MDVKHIFNKWSIEYPLCLGMTKLIVYTFYHFSLQSSILKICELLEELKYESEEWYHGELEDGINNSVDR